MNFTAEGAVFSGTFPSMDNVDTPDCLREAKR